MSELDHALYDFRAAMLAKFEARKHTHGKWRESKRIIVRDACGGTGKYVWRLPKEARA